MSLETWKKEFYPLNAEEITDPLQAILHGIRKWRGLREENFTPHELRLGAFLQPYLADQENRFEFDSFSCALCHNFLHLNHRIPCTECPLFMYLGHACDEGEDAPFNLAFEGDPEPMITALEETLTEYCLERVELSLEDGFENTHSLYCTKCLTPTIQVVRPGDFRCSQCGGA